MAKNKKVPEINASSMADISFLLLIFFLVSTTMNVDYGLQRILPPFNEDTTQDVDVNKRNVLMVNVSMYDQVMVGDERNVDMRRIKDIVKDFLQNPGNDPNKSDKEIIEIEGLGSYPVSKGIISLQNDRGTSYSVYIQVQNELMRAINEIRDDVSVQKYGKKFMDLSEDQRSIMQKAVPQKISEAEPRNIGGAK